ncbi:hypothetical protein GGS24DRAFT_515743 [Hypoxylon argillaceum]|nr:hypothetical protein GGS24DRAFT_515743 [Hypoxylon argillaceum]
MASRRPAAAYTLERAAPEWSARITSETTTRTDAARLHDAEPIEFILSSNWVLRTDGVKDFYEALYKHAKNWEIGYDPTLHGFRIKCLSKDEVEVVSLVRGTLDKLVQKETKKGVEMSTKIISLENWRNKCQAGKETVVPSKYAFPRDVAICDVRDTWNISDDWSKRGVTTRCLLPESVLYKVQQLTSTVLLLSSDGCVVYIGASRVGGVTKVKQKLDTLARFFLSTPRDITQLIEIFLYNEGDRSLVGEYRFLADGNSGMLRGYILDRFDWPHTDLRYPSIFQKGVIVRPNPDRTPWKEDESISNTILPIVKNGKEVEEFRAFKLKNWKYPVKDVAPTSDTSTTQTVSSLTDHQSILRPKIENWVSGIPAPREGKLKLGQPNTADETMENSVDSVVSVPSGSTHSVTLEKYKPHKHDPFERLWREFREVTNTKSKPEGEKVQGDRRNLQVSVLNEELEPQLAQTHETDDRSFHITMNQKAGSRMIPLGLFPEFDPNMMTSINKSLVRLLAPLRMWPGFVDFRIDLGRFCFLNVKKSRIQEPGDDDDEKHYRLDQIQNELNKRHKAHEKLFFTRILTSLGADANYIACINDNNGIPMWERPTDGRSSTYEFTCRSKTVEGAEFDFTVDIDATKFTSRVKQFKPDQNCFAVHCTKRVWDFQIVLSVSQELTDVCGHFAEDLVRSLRVVPNNDRIPELEVSYSMSYDIEVLAVRTRNTACCTSKVSVKNTCSTQCSPQEDTQRLYISEVWEMDRLRKVENKQHVQLKFARYKRNDEHPGMPLVWYETTLKSDTFSAAFKQNEELELGNEVKWTPEELLKRGVVEGLVRKAANMVKNMDGVGYWNDNHQQEVLRRVMPTWKPLGSQNTDKYW